MHFSRLQEFIILAEECSFQNAAEICGIHKAALSRHIRDLEMELGVPLFERTTQKVEISEYGEIFLPYAKRLIKENEISLEETHEIVEKAKHRLTIGIDPMYSKKGIEIICRFEEQNNDVKVTALIDSSLTLESMDSQKCDAKLVHEMNKECSSEESLLAINEDHLAIVLPEDHPLANEEAVSLKKLKNDQFILLNRNSTICKSIIMACKNEGFDPIVKYSSTRVDNIVNMITKGMGITILTRGPMEKRNDEKIKFVNIIPPISIYSLIIYRKDNDSPSLKKFIDYFKNDVKYIEKNNIVEEIK